jgi:hypothetical protein
MMMMADDLRQKWDNRELKVHDIFVYLERQWGGACNSVDDLMHVANGCYSLYMVLTKQYSSVGSFLSAVLANDFLEVAQCADDVNIRNLRLYMLFLCNVAPAYAAYRAQLKKDENEDI